jgi:hypothetical protein
VNKLRSCEVLARKKQTSPTSVGLKTSKMGAFDLRVIRRTVGNCGFDKCDGNADRVYVTGNLSGGMKTEALLRLYPNFSGLRPLHGRRTILFVKDSNSPTSVRLDTSVIKR